MAEIDIYDYISADKKYYIYGTAGIGMFFCEKITALYGQECVLGFLETSPIAKKCFGKSVFSPNEFGKLEKEIKIIIASATHFMDMKNILMSRGILEEQIIIPYKVFDFFKNMCGQERENIVKVCFWPPIYGNALNLIKKINWFIPDRIKVSVWCDDEELKTKFNTNVCIEHITDKNSVFDSSDMILLWNTDIDNTEYDKFNFKVFVVDPNLYFYTEISNYSKLYYYSFSDLEKMAYEEKSKEIFKELKGKVKGYFKARIFGSGPSIEEIYENEYKNSINIICNSVVKNKEWLERIAPQILIFGDVSCFLSPNDYCQRFLEDVKSGQKLYDYYIVVYDFEVPLLLAHCPELSGKVIGISNKNEIFAFPSEKHLKVKATKNIMSEIMIPIASALCDEIEIAGCTGQDYSENRKNADWKYQERMQYLDLMPTVIEMYPSIFRDQKYDNYYEYHCQCMEEILKYGEEKGKKYRNITTSYIPALAKRTAHKE